MGRGPSTLSHAERTERAALVQTWHVASGAGMCTCWQRAVIARSPWRTVLAACAARVQGVTCGRAAPEDTLNYLPVHQSPMRRPIPSHRKQTRPAGLTGRGAFRIGRAYQTTPFFSMMLA